VHHHPHDSLETQIGLPVMNHDRYGAPSSDDVDDSNAPFKESLLLPNNNGGRVTLFSCIINLANTIVGMLGLSGAFWGTGYVGRSILIFLGASFSAHGLVLLSKSAQRAVLPSSFYTGSLLVLLSIPSKQTESLEAKSGSKERSSPEVHKNAFFS
jgi:hypothetical protein